MPLAITEPEFHNRTVRNLPHIRADTRPRAVSGVTKAGHGCLKRRGGNAKFYHDRTGETSPKGPIACADPPRSGRSASIWRCYDSDH